jgi:hypothetical protein
MMVRLVVNICDLGLAQHSINDIFLGRHAVDMDAAPFGLNTIVVTTAKQ